MSRTWHVIYLAAIAASVAFALRLAQPHAEPPGQPQAEPPAQSQADPLAFQAALIQHTNNFERVTWLGHPIWQSVPDVWTLQETIAEIKPALVIECGTYKGGSALFMAHLFDLMGHGKVVTVDIEKLHALSHPRVTFLIGDSVSPAIIGQIRNAAAKTGGPIMVLLDSDHSQAHEGKTHHIACLLSRDFLRRGCIVAYRTGVLAIPPRTLAIVCLRPSRCLLRRLSPRAGTQASRLSGRVLSATRATENFERIATIEVASILR